ncbi:MAG: SDR family oxidoreductase [Gammaproteobacteria bacterium]|jgi:NAD(P)-dependent dehydrogenase (short-subunit alcohol dehydrogenase family)|nr:SDR family oxidoreductase [Gammaproteobacteria bacterium]MBT3723932.1 SDR family oxidoreductase [Gammaproteobacteria bacterium]MBT4075420.1 SDR family oxidoreductase [Gammaproteobacteria bacterium]MBT4193797.1 SDR family oxidoreductase [Gammaproteobacteria bacterium]MBT4449836.1 SDR family oxidoreductase [Gammaproteobacteria bacterium]
MKLDLSGKRIIITGASSGIGEHFARLLNSEGASLGLIARRQDKLNSLTKELNALNNHKVFTSRCDILSESDIEASMTDLHSQLGGVDILINNAGITHQSIALKQSIENWDSVINTNLRGSWLCATLAAKLMSSDGKPGSIINIASILGMAVANQLAPYAISKAAIVQMTKALALEWARLDIRVNALAPGYLRTDLNAEFFETTAGKALIKRIPQRRLGKLSDLDAPLCLLCSDSSNFMTGITIPVDGGHLVSSL